jgi:amylosucrase
LVRVRAQLPSLHASMPAQVLDESDPGILAVLRHHPEGDLLCLYNVTDSWRPWPGDRLAHHGFAQSVDRLTGEPARVGDDGNLWLSPCAAVWLDA